MPPGAILGSTLSEFQNSYGSAANSLAQAQAGAYRAYISQHEQPAKKMEIKPMNYVKEYFIKHRELIMGFAIICLLDHYIFKDAFKEKLQRIVHGFLDKTEKKLTESA